MAIVMILLFSAVGALFVGTGFWGIFVEIRRVYRVHHWPNVVGQVLSSQVTESDNDGRSYNVHVEYQYRVLGYPYTGSENLMSVEANVRQQAEGLRNSYPVGLRLPITYTPQRPEQSEIADDAQRGIKMGGILWAVAQIAFSVLWTYAITGGFGTRWGEP